MAYGSIKADRLITSSGEVDLAGFAPPEEATQSEAGLISAADKTKLDGVEAGAQVNDPDTVIDANYVATDENFTTADHAKLNGIDAGAQVNAVTSVNGETGAVTVQGFSGDYDDLTNTPAIPTSNIGLTNDANYITAAEAPVQPEDLFSGSYSDLTGKPTIPSATSELTNDSGYITAADVPAAPDVPTKTSDLTNDSGYITAAQAPVQPADLFSGSYNDLTGKPTIPTSNSELTNDENYITAAEAPVQVSDLPAVGDGTITIQSYGQNAAADSTFHTNQVLNQTITLPQIRYGDIKNRPSIPQNTSDLTNDSNFLVPSDITGKADLVDGVLAISQIPPLAVAEYKGSVANEAAMLQVSGEPGDWLSRQDDGKVYVITDSDPSQLSSWTALSYPVGFSGAYGDLTGKPSIPSATSDLTNDSGFITSAGAPVQPGDLFSGAYADLTGKPTLGSAAATDSSAYATSAQGTKADSATQPGDLASVATSGSYNDLSGRPTIPSDTTDLTNGAGYITSSSLPTDTTDLTNNAGYITSAQAPVQPGDLFSGSYNDLSNKPTIPTNNNQLSNGAGYATTSQLFSGSYNDLSNKPTLTLQGITDNGATTTNSVQVGMLRMTASNAYLDHSGDGNLVIRKGSLLGTNATIDGSGNWLIENEFTVKGDMKTTASLRVKENMKLGGTTASPAVNIKDTGEIIATNTIKTTGDIECNGLITAGYIMAEAISFVNLIELP